METRKIYLGYLVLIAVHLTLSHSPEAQTRAGGAPGSSEDSAGSTELVESCKKIDEKSLIILCETHCEVKISKELTDITEIDNGTWLNSQESFEENPNRCKCCTREMPFTEKPANNAPPNETRRVFSSLGGSVYEDDYYKQIRIVRDELEPFMLIFIFLVFVLGLCYIIVFSLCSCLLASHFRKRKVVKTRPISISNCSSRDSINSTMIVCESQVEPNKDNALSNEDIVSKSFTTPDSHPAIQVTAL